MKCTKKPGVLAHALGAGCRTCAVVFMILANAVALCVSIYFMTTHKSDDIGFTGPPISGPKSATPAPAPNFTQRGKK